MPETRLISVSGMSRFRGFHFSRVSGMLHFWGSFFGFWHVMLLVGWGHPQPLPQPVPQPHQKPAGHIRTRCDGFLQNGQLANDEGPDSLHSLQKHKWPHPAYTTLASALTQIKHLLRVCRVSSGLAPVRSLLRPEAFKHPSSKKLPLQARQPLVATHRWQP